jgi:dethiobiotin synthetase
LGPAIYSIWGANTGVGKTLASVGLVQAAKQLKASNILLLTARPEGVTLV